MPEALQPGRTTLPGMVAPPVGPLQPRPAPEVPESYPAICHFGRFELLNRIALGGMAEVFLAREHGEQGIRRHVAIKRVLPHIANDQEFIDMFRDEARLAMQLRHPNVCHIYEFGVIDGAHYLSMEWIHGVSLSKLMRRARKADGIPGPIAVKIIAHVAEALHSAHHGRDAMGRPLNMVHRDVSPQNIMISFDGQVKLLDFGVAKASTQDAQTRAGAVKGKFSYMSPEQCRGSQLDGRSDLFSLGVCLYEAVTGKPLYHRESQLAAMSAIVNEPPPSAREVLPGMPQELDAIIQKTLTKHPHERFETAGHLQVALEGLLASQGQVVNSFRITEFLQTLFQEEASSGPLVGSTPFGASIHQQGPSLGSGSSPRMTTPRMTTPRMTTPRAASPVPDAPTPPRGIEISVGHLDDELPVTRSLRWYLVLGASIVLASALMTALVVTLGAPDDAPAAATTSTGRTATPRAATPAPRPEPRPAEQPSAPSGSAQPPTEPTPVAEAPAAEPPEAVPAQLGIVVVRTTPPGALVRIGDRAPPDSTPVVLEGVPPGTYPVTITRAGHEPWTGEVEVRAGQTATVRAALRARAVATTAATGTLSLTTGTPARVYQGPRLLGTTPLSNVTVPAGTLRLRLIASDGQVYMRAVRVQPDQHARVFFPLGGN